MAEKEITPVHWKTILDRLDEGFCVPFLGAAVNIRCPGFDNEGLPLGGDVALCLLRTMIGVDDEVSLEELARVKRHAKLAGYPELTRLLLQDLPRVALRYASGTDPKGFLKSLEEILPDESRRASRLLVTLAGLPLKLIVTTNYDRLMERAFESLHWDDLIEPAAIASVIMNDPRPLFAAMRNGLSAAGAEVLRDAGDTAKLASRIADHGDPIAAPVRLRYPHYFEKGMLIARGIEGLVHQAVLEELNLILQPIPAAASLFSTAAVADLALTASVTAQLQEALSSVERTRVYRQILESAFGGAIQRIERPLKVIVQPPRGFRGKELNALQNEIAGHDGVTLYKLHGSFGHRDRVGDTRLVITEEDYIEFLAFVGNNIPNLVTEQITDSSLLFLGYGLEDWNFRAIFKGLVETLPNRSQRVSFAIQKSPSDFWVRFWGTKGVSIYDLELHEFAHELGQRYRARRAAKPAVVR